MVLIVGPGALGRVLASKAPGKTVLLGRGRKPAPAQKPELAVFCVKAQDLARAAKGAAAWIGPDTAVVGLQNGLEHGKILRAAFGAARVAAGSCYVAARRVSPTESAHEGGKLIKLAKSKDNAAAADRAAAWLKKGGWEVRLEKDEARMLWTKLCFNAATNPLAALCRATNGQLASDPALRHATASALAEAVAEAGRRGVKPLISDMEGFLMTACAGAPDQRNSMLQDLEAGRPTELEALLGPLKKAGPILSALYRWTREVEAR
jgi:2-dehydropantoate 2-reductase